MPGLRPEFWSFVTAGGLGQIIDRVCTVALFSERSFTVGIIFTKTETPMFAGFSGLQLGEAVSVPGLIAILIGMAGVTQHLSWFVAFGLQHAA